MATFETIFEALLTVEANYPRPIAPFNDNGTWINDLRPAINSFESLSPDRRLTTSLLPKKDNFNKFYEAIRRANRGY